MTINFDAPSSFNSRAGFHRIKFGENAPLLETELNEMQDIIGDKFSILLEEIVGEGRFLNFDIEVNADTGLFQFSGTAFINSTLVKISTLSNSSTDSEVHIFLGYKEVDINANSTINSYGNLQGTSTEINNLIDVRVGEETSRRKQIVYNLFENQLDESYNYIELGIKRSGGRPEKYSFTVNENIKAKGIGSEDLQQELDNLIAEYEAHKNSLASKTEFGHMRVGDGLTVNNGVVNSEVRTVTPFSASTFPEIGRTQFLVPKQQTEIYNSWKFLLNSEINDVEVLGLMVESVVFSNYPNIVSQNVTVIHSYQGTASRTASRTFKRVVNDYAIGSAVFTELNNATYIPSNSNMTIVTPPSLFPLGVSIISAILHSDVNLTIVTFKNTQKMGNGGVASPKTISQFSFNNTQGIIQTRMGNVETNTWGNWVNIHPLPDASTTTRGIVQLEDTRTSSSKTSAPTADALRSAHADLNSSKVNKIQSAEIVASSMVSWDSWWRGTRYHKDEMGFVRVWISIRRNTKPMFGSTLLTLPVGYRPLQDMYSYIYNSRVGLMPLHIYTDGIVSITTPPEQILDGEIFIAYFTFKV